MKKKKYLPVLSLLFVIALLYGSNSSLEPTIQLKGIDILPAATSTKVILTTDSPLPINQAFFDQTLPSTLVVNLPRVKTVPTPPNLKTNNGVIRNISLKKESNGEFKLFIDLTQKVPYTIVKEKDKTIIELLNLNGQLNLNEIQKKMAPLETQSLASFQNLSIHEKAEKLVIKAKISGQALPYVFALDNPLRLVVDLYNTYLSHPPLNIPVGKFGLKKIRAAQFQVNNPYTISRLVFDLESPRFYTLEAEENGLTISFYKNQVSDISLVNPQKSQATSPPPPPKTSPPVTKVTPPLPEPEKTSTALTKETPVVSPAQEEQFQPKTIAQTQQKYTGEIISLRFKDADLRDVILYLADFAGLNVVFDPGVRGTVTVDLEDVPWDQALDLILKINKMGKIIEGNVLRIAPIDVLTEEQKQAQKLAQSKELAGPVIVKTFTLSYSKAADVQSLLKTKLSERGEIIIDNRTNTLIVTDVKDRMDLIEKLISVFDTPTPQVAIEARIVEATSTFIRNLGIQWGWRGISDPFYGNQTSLQFPNKVLVDGAMIPQGIVTKGIGGPLGGYAINLPAPAFSTAIGLSLGNVLDTFRLDMALSALETSGSGRIISTPTVTTQNNQEAEIIQGRQIPVQTVANFTVTTRYVNAALELKATPQITAEGTIIMYIEIQNNAADFANLVNGIPPIITQSAKTTVMVPDGGTAVIGGIYRTEDSITRERVPFLHKIPILGNLFRSFALTKQNRELLIFITPRIIK
jgi:type IV pilus assembly protein PilQ